MSKKKPFEHEIDPELLAEIEEWEQQIGRASCRERV